MQRFAPCLRLTPALSRWGEVKPRRFALPEDVSATHPAKRLRPPSWEHPFGTDTLGRDVYSRVLYGGRITLMISMTVVSACILIGVPAGLVAGYCDNIVGHVVMRLADIFLAVPRVILALALSQALGPSLPNMLLALTITYWPWFARTVTAETRSVKQSTFVEASEALGMRPMRIIFCHVLPNVLSPIIVRSSVGMGFTILTAAALGFLGVGAQPPTVAKLPSPAPSWGLSPNLRLAFEPGRFVSRARTCCRWPRPTSRAVFEARR